MKPLPGTIYGKGDPFAPTHWSIVLTAARGDGNTATSEAALATLCQTYWAPLYTYVRSRGHDTHDAQDLMQGFFAHLVEHRIHERVDPEKGKFRSFLVAAMKNFLVDAIRHAQALKRGGPRTELPLLAALVEEAESLYQNQRLAPGPDAQADRAFDLCWAQAIVDAALAQLAHAYLHEGKPALFTALKPFVTGCAGSPPTYGELAASLGMPASTVRSHVTRLRALSGGTPRGSAPDRPLGGGGAGGDPRADPRADRRLTPGFFLDAVLRGLLICRAGCPRWRPFARPAGPG